MNIELNTEQLQDVLGALMVRETDLFGLNSRQWMDPEYQKAIKLVQSSIAVVRTVLKNEGK
jgi:hypothetical protein